MKLRDILTPGLTLCCDDSVQTKKQALHTISIMIADVDSRIKDKRVFDALMKREQLGSTAVGHGFAIPHARISDLKGAICVILSLKSPINFDSDDNHQPVDIIFGLLVPEAATGSHLEILSDIALHLKDGAYRRGLRMALDSEQIYEAAIGDLALG
jgi:nitrogen PTS system EIIA component